jgi:hypothetical protein
VALAISDQRQPAVSTAAVWPRQDRSFQDQEAVQRTFAQVPIFPPGLWLQAAAEQEVRALARAAVLEEGWSGQAVEPLKVEAEAVARSYPVASEAFRMVPEVLAKQEA